MAVLPTPTPIFDGSEGGPISSATAGQWTRRYRTSHAEGSNKGFVFGSQIINQILQQPGCVGLRTYHAVDDHNLPHLILVGVDAYGNDLVNGIVGNEGLPCPPHQSAQNVLNY